MTLLLLSGCATTATVTDDGADRIVALATRLACESFTAIDDTDSADVAGHNAAYASLCGDGGD
ncbi:hypothetical protein [Martelella sp. HB161492]|uniref:hypothetical protein n=1 Tax=Martelella sp. HB161492 TaxID=2720726 RepID=UPI00159108BF|nr:hypothetical protein [Martelella sp. HB161492]